MPTCRPTIPQPCSASWAEMAPAVGGRHCAACQKTVVDFTQKTTAEMQAYLALNQPGEVCGRFRTGQLRQPAPRLLTRRAAPWLALSVAAVLTLTHCTSESSPVILVPPTEKVSARMKEVKGEILDGDTQRPLAGALVVCSADTSYRVRTDASGQFSLLLPEELASGDFLASAPANGGGWAVYIPQCFKPNRKEPILIQHHAMILGEPAPDSGETRLPPPKVTSVKFTPPAPKKP